MYFSLSFIDLITVTFIEKNLVKNLDTVVIVQIFRIDNGMIPSDIIDTAIQYLHFTFQELLGILVPV